MHSLFTRNPTEFIIFVLMIEVLFISLVAASLTLFLNYCFGKPSGEFSPYEIFSSYTIWLSIRRLRSLGLYQEHLTQYEVAVKKARSVHEVLTIKQQFKSILYNAADPFFTWERAAGMCPVCTGVLVTLGTGLVAEIVLNLLPGLSFSENLLYLLSIIFISHVLIRLINKWI